MDKKTWNDLLASFPHPQILQTWEWGEVKEKYGWKAHHKIWRGSDGEVQAMALILEREIDLKGMAPRIRMLYLPKGPILKDWTDAVWREKVIRDITDFAKKRGAFLLKIESDTPIGFGEEFLPDEKNSAGSQFIQELKEKGWHYSKDQIQFKNSVFVDLTADEDDLLARMKQKTRYNIRLAMRKGVEVVRGTRDDFELLYSIYAETALRDGFAIRSKDYYFNVWESFIEADMLTPLIARVEGEPVAGLMLFHAGRFAWYIYGMSRPVHRKLMPTYLLQWEAMRIAKEKKCEVYDLWGAPETFDQSDRLWGVYRFKRGFGGETARHIGAWDLPLRPWIYKLYAEIMPRFLGILRRQGNQETRKQAQGN